jgi:hypothetical protein
MWTDVARAYGNGKYTKVRAVQEQKLELRSRKEPTAFNASLEDGIERGGK